MLETIDYNKVYPVISRLTFSDRSQL